MHYQDTFIDNSGYSTDSYNETFTDMEFSIDSFCDEQEAFNHLQIDLLDLEILDMSILEDTEDQIN
ncbi:MAG: hypothetical protein K0U68_05965 [Gammaproteobacteria bacterium]|nr:hypothetical protein [Gammaproteobacteria bacterium]